MIRIQGFPNLRGQGPVLRLFSALLLLAVFALAVTLGFFILLGMLAVIAILAAVFYVRFWWLHRNSTAGTHRPPGGVTLEGEYTVSKSRQITARDDRD
jgi:hypothetical protein